MEVKDETRFCRQCLMMDQVGEGKEKLEKKRAYRSELSYRDEKIRKNGFCAERDKRARLSWQCKERPV